MMSRIHRIAIVGAECTGKSALCSGLAQRQSGVCVPEFLRQFCEEKGRTPTALEQASIVRKQISIEIHERQVAQSKNACALFIDSTPLVTAAYSRFFFGDVGLLAAAIAHQRHYDATLLADIDLLWVPDGFMRDGPMVRNRFHRLLCTLLEVHQIKHAIVCGLNDDRIGNAETALSGLLAGA